MNDLPDNLQQQVLKFVVTLRQQHFQPPSNAWDVLESLTCDRSAPNVSSGTIRSIAPSAKPIAKAQATTLLCAIAQISPPIGCRNLNLANELGLKSGAAESMDEFSEQLYLPSLLAHGKD